jgi:hypothetical protein
MMIQRMAVLLTGVNLVLLLVLILGRTGPVEAAENTAPVLRGRALEIVDSQGRIRASITVEPAVTANGNQYPETVLLRMADPESGPVVKVTASKHGSSMGLSDDAEGGVELFAYDSASFVRVMDGSGGLQLVKP